MLGVIPQIGRLYGPQDFAPGFAPKAVISDGCGAVPMAPIRMFSAVPSGSTMIPLQLLGFCHADFAISRSAPLLFGNGPSYNEAAIALFTGFALCWRGWCGAVVLKTW